MMVFKGSRRVKRVRLSRPQRRRRTAVSGVVSLALIGGLGGVAVAAEGAGGFGGSTVGSDNGAGTLLPSNQRVRPIGTRSLVNNGRLLSSTLSPDGTKLAALSWENFNGFLTIMDVRTGHIVQQLGTGSKTDPTIGDGAVAADGPLYSRDGKTLWFPQAADLVRFAVGPDGMASAPVVIPLHGVNGGALPSGMALSPDGRELYVALNGNNTLGTIDTATNTLVKEIPVGIAPRQVVVVGSKAFVSNEGGRTPAPGEFTNETDGTAVVASPSTGAAASGTVSVVDLAAQAETTQIKVGLQPTAEHLAADGTLMVANSNADSVSLIDTRRERVTQTFNTNPLPGSTVGSYPNAITMPDANHILVSIGRDNALAVYRYNGPMSPVQYEGLLPTDWYPVNVEMDNALHQLVVTNDKGIGARGPQTTISKGPGTNPATGHNTYNDTGSVTVFSSPTERQLAGYTKQVFTNNDWNHLLASTSLAKSNATPVAVPARLGQPSKIKHVFLIVRENRTYDQVLGDIGKGTSDPTLAQFGAYVTPNAHSLASSFSLFDNFYDEGTLSADGHNWLMQADTNDYIEKQFGAFARSYPAQGGDALAYQRDGFLWNAAEKAGSTVKAFGEYNNFESLPTPAPTWSQWYQDSQVLEGKASGPLPVPESAQYTSSDMPSLNAIDDHAYPKFDLGIPDQYRADIWLQSFRQSEATGQLANLTLIWLPDDHTSGVGGGNPDPIAQVADNDLALGRIVSAISHSKFWGSSAIFANEDDTQDGTDSVDGHRSPMLIASPYARRGQLNDTYYTQLNLVKTIEQILGIAPMNQEDRAALPMFDAFTDTANNTPYETMPNQVPLTQGVTPAPTPAKAAAAPTTSAPTTSPPTTSAPTTSAPTAVLTTPAPATVPAAALPVYQKWVKWSSHQSFSGAKASPDRANPRQLNRVDWYTTTGWTTPYPGDRAILAPDEVPGANLPAAVLGD